MKSAFLLGLVMTLMQVGGCKSQPRQGVEEPLRPEAGQGEGGAPHLVSPQLPANSSKAGGVGARKLRVLPASINSGGLSVLY